MNAIIIIMNGNGKIPSLSELRAMRKPVRNINLEQKSWLNSIEKAAVWVTENVGSMGFFFIIFIWTVSWIGWNTFGPKLLRFDPYPAFVLWLFISNIIQIHLLPLIMIGQNILSRHSEARAEADYDINSKTEREMEAVILHLEYQKALLEEIRVAMEKKKSGRAKKEN